MNDKIPNLFAEDYIPIVIVITRTRWDEPPRIRHQVTRQLVRFYNVIYIEKNIGLKTYRRGDHIEQINERFAIYRPNLPLPIHGRIFSNDPITHYVVNTFFRKKIINFLKQTRNHNRILVNFEFDFPEIMKSKFFNFKLYICNDEFPKSNIRYKGDIKGLYQYKILQYYENQVIRNADKCLAVSYPLRDKLKKLNPETDIFLPGHECKHISYNNKGKRCFPVRVAFMGFINRRIDKEYLLEILKNKDMFLYLIGPIEKFDADFFSRFNNIEFVSFLSGESLQKILGEMGVLIIPYKTNSPELKAITASNKFFQYLAAGKPVVISDMPNFIEMPYGVIYRAKTAKDFVKKIRQAYKEDNEELINMRLKIAEENTWDKRGDMLYNIIEKAI